jgi:uncharacterized protein (TIGR02145 family)
MNFKIRMIQSLIFMIVILIFSSCKIYESDSLTVPVLTTIEISNITQTSANCGGIIESNGGSTITTRGVCWSTEKNPSILDSKTYDGTDIGEYTSTISGLPVDTIFVRAYASNSLGPGYGDIVSFIIDNRSAGTIQDIDDNIYNTIAIGDQIWMNENLKVTHYQDGSPIENIISKTEWRNSSSGALCDYNNDPLNQEIYGKLYNWFALEDSRNICPTGWHIPTHQETNELELYLIENGYNYDGGTYNNALAKSLASGYGWQSSSDFGVPGNTDYPAKINASGLTVLPGGYRDKNGVFHYAGSSGFLWDLGGDYNDTLAWYRNIDFRSVEAERFTASKLCGMSVRCIKD